MRQHTRLVLVGVRSLGLLCREMRRSILTSIVRALPLLNPVAARHGRTERLGGTEILRARTLIQEQTRAQA
jgi:hypothetical protein